MHLFRLAIEQAQAEDPGFPGMILAGDQPPSSALTRELLGWRPVQPGLTEDLGQGHYFSRTHSPYGGEAGAGPPGGWRDPVRVHASIAVVSSVYAAG